VESRIRSDQLHPGVDRRAVRGLVEERGDRVTPMSLTDGPMRLPGPVDVCHRELEGDVPRPRADEVGDEGPGPLAYLQTRTRAVLIVVGVVDGDLPHIQTHLFPVGPDGTPLLPLRRQPHVMQSHDRILHTRTSK